MNSDTERSVKEILKRGWYEMHQTLGEGGWALVAKESAAWHRYRILLPADYAQDIYARDDNAALKCFHETYRLDEVPYLIQEVITNYRTIEES